MQSALLLGCWVWGFRRFGPDALVFAAFSLQDPSESPVGQDCVLLLVLFILAFELKERGKAGLSGAALALMLIKFHLILLWPIALLCSVAGKCSEASAPWPPSRLASRSLSRHARGTDLHSATAKQKSRSPLALEGTHDLLPGTHCEFGNRVARWIALLIGAILLLFAFAVYNAPIWKMFAITAVASLC